MFTRAPQDDRHEFKPLLVEIEERPLNPLGRTVFWIVIAAILFTFLWMFFGKVDIVVTARGKIIPSGEVKTVQPLNIGVVRSILIQPGDYVEKGQVLMEIDPSDIDPELASTRADYQRVGLEIQRISALLDNRDFSPAAGDVAPDVLRVQQKIFHAEKNRLNTQIRVKQEILAQLEEKLAAEYRTADQARYMTGILSERLDRLEQVRDIVSRDEYEQTQSQAKQYETEYIASTHRIAEIKALKLQTDQEIDYIKKEFRNRLLAELSEKKQDFLYLQARIERAEFISTRQQITSPVNGHISQLLFHTTGGVVTPAEALAHIVPVNTPLLVKAVLLSKDAGFVAAHMAASIKLDAFNFQKYGTLDASVVRVSKDSIEDERLGLIYETYIAPEQLSLIVDGKETLISPGMGVTAEINVGKRRIIEFFIYPLIRYLDEGMSVK